MLNSVVLDTAIGMAFVFLLMSLIASVAQEILATFMQLRPANLQRGLRSLFSGDSIWGVDLVDAVYNHGLVRGLYSDPKMDLKAPLTNDGVAPQDVPGAKMAIRLAAVDALLSMNTMRSALRWLIGIRPEEDVSGVSQQLLLPAYIPSQTFALALIDILNSNKAMGQEAMNAITKSLAEHHWTYKGNKAGEALFTLAVDAKGDLTAFQKNIENWYNDAMDRVSGWYKRYTQKILLLIGLALAIAFNVDSVRVARTLWADRDVRQAMVNAAGAYVKENPSVALGDAPGSITGESSNAGEAGQSGATGNSKAKSQKNEDKTDNAIRSEVQQMNVAVGAFNRVTSSSLLPVGWKQPLSMYWKEFWNDRRGTTMRLLGSTMLPGWLITAMAVSLGAPFWFDTLNKFMVVRSTIKPREKSQVEATKD